MSANNRCMVNDCKKGFYISIPVNIGVYITGFRIAGNLLQSLPEPIRTILIVAAILTGCGIPWHLLLHRH